MPDVALNILPFSLPRLRDTLVAHYRRLSVPSRSLRFMGSMNEEVMSGIARNAAPDLFLTVNCDGEHRAVLELFVLDHGHAEIALSVEDAYQGRGYGRALFHRGISEARDMGLSTVDVFFLATNQAIRKLCLEEGGDINCTGAECTSHIPLS